MSKQLNKLYNVLLLVQLGVVIIEGQSLIKEHENYDQMINIQELISQLPLVFLGETLLKGRFCLSQNLLYKLLQLIVKFKEDIQKLDIDIEQNVLTLKMVVRRKKNIFTCLLKIEKIEINLKNNHLILYLKELPQIQTSNILQNLFVGLGTMVTNLKSGEEFVLKYLIGNKRGIAYSDQKITFDIRNIPYVNEIYVKEIFGLRFIDVVEMREVHIKEGVIELFWDVAIPSAEKLNLE